MTEQGKCKDCKHYKRYEDYKKRCAYYESMPNPVEPNQDCEVNNKTFYGFKKLAK